MKQVAEGRCFVCNEAGHFSRNCPKANSMKGKGGKPPGLSTFNAEIERSELRFSSTMKMTSK